MFILLIYSLQRPRVSRYNAKWDNEVKFLNDDPLPYITPFHLKWYDQSTYMCIFNSNYYHHFHQSSFMMPLLIKYSDTDIHTYVGSMCIFRKVYTKLFVEIHMQYAVINGMHVTERKRM